MTRSLQHLKDKYSEQSTSLQNGECNGAVSNEKSGSEAEQASSNAEETSAATLFERMTQNQRQAYETLQKHVSKQLEAVRARLENLGARGQKPAPLSFVECVDALIESESRAQQPGWSDRVQQLRRTRTDAVLVSTLDDLSAKATATPAGAAATAPSGLDTPVTIAAATLQNSKPSQPHANGTANSKQEFSVAK